MSKRKPPSDPPEKPEGGQIVPIEVARKARRELERLAKEGKKRRGGKNAAGPASGTPASGLPAMGPGWGGPAKGSFTPFEPGHPYYAPREDSKARAANVLDKLYTLAISAESEGVQMMAAERFLDRVEGKPVQRVLDDRKGGTVEEVRTRDAQTAMDAYEEATRAIK
jgi:hypothetical protein